jgi:DNA-binding beta-propeller fold protein YncE
MAVIWIFLPQGNLLFTFFILDNVYIGDSNNHRIRKVTVSTSIITTIVGTGTSSYTGDGGAATSATLNYPSGIALDASGNYLYCNKLVIKK